MAEILKNFSLVESAEDVGEVLNSLDREPAFSIDVETTGLDYVKDKLHGTGVANSQAEWFLIGAANDTLVSRLPELYSKEFIFHNATFDLHFLGEAGVRPPKIFDTMVGQWLVDENQELALKTLANTKLGIEEKLPDFKDLLMEAKKRLKKKKVSDVNIFDIPIETLAPYAGKDVRLTFDLRQRTAYELEQEKMTRMFFDIEMPFLYVILDMEDAGFYIDQERLHFLSQEIEEKRIDALKTFQNLSGVDNPNSNAQISKYLFTDMKYKSSKQTASGNESVDIMSLMRLLPKDKNGAVAALIDYRKYSKLQSTYTEKFTELTASGDRLKSHFNQCGTVTGRLSSSQPTNLQNIPARGEMGTLIRQLFAAYPGYAFIDIDYSQLELRICAHYTKDPNLIQVFLDHGDPHQLTADLCKVARYIGKTLNFGVLYGAGPRTLADTVEKSGYDRPSEKDTKDWLQRFDTAYPAIAHWKRSVVEYARNLGYVKTIGGRKRRLPDINAFDNGIRSGAERQAVNSIIQGSAADIIKYAMLSIKPYMPEYGVSLLAQVHDELCFEAPIDVSDEFAALSSNMMVGVGEYFNMRVALEATPGVGANWSEAKH